MVSRRALAAVACIAGSLVPRDAAAVEASADVAPSAGASTWRGDRLLGGQLRLALRFARVVAVDVVNWEMLATVDRRANTGLTLGITGFLPLPKVRPFARAFVIHQHEEGLVSVEDHPMGTLFGIGAGIRHRAGAGGTLGAELPMAAARGREWYLVGGATTAWFPDATLGPSAYFIGFFGVGASLELMVAP